MRLFPVGRYHTIITQEVIGTPGLVVPVLYLKGKDGNITIHAQLHEYLLAHRSKSLTWKRNAARAVGLFWDYLRAGELVMVKHTSINLHRTIFRQFCESLLFGTINIETKIDSLGLYWPSTPWSRARIIAGCLQYFVTWVVEEAAGTGKEFDVSTIANLPAPQRDAYPTDSTLATRFMVVAHRLKALSFFSHLKNTSEIATKLHEQHQRQIYDFGHSEDSFDADPAIYMEPRIVAAILKHGFTKDPSKKRKQSQKPLMPWDNEDITAKMVFYLLAFGGLRISEPFHLWFNDVIPLSTFKCRVVLRHPSQARTHFIGEGKTTRQEYLAKLGLLPRNADESTRSYHAGWKNLPTDKNKNAPVFWLHSGAEAEFAALYKTYLTYRKIQLAQRQLRGLRDHPFLFVSSGEDRHAGVSRVGDPYSIAAFRKAWSKALARTEKALGIKLVEAKENGTTPHATRHFYGQTLSESGTDKKVIQKALRHRTVLSQEPYTTPDYKRVNHVLIETRKRIENGAGALDLSPVNKLFSS